MNEPITIVYEDFRKELANLINNSGLPAFIIELILKDYLNETSMVRQRQYLSDKAQYEKELSNDKK